MVRCAGKEALSGGHVHTYITQTVNAAVNEGSFQPAHSRRWGAAEQIILRYLDLRELYVQSAKDADHRGLWDPKEATWWSGAHFETDC